jgi:NADP-dependent 3-hydroxy acid dehydrogenase YdfG
MANSKDVVVTGVSTGIGWGTTTVLISKGFRVFGSVRKRADADRLQSEFGNAFVPLMMDITDADAVHQAAPHAQYPQQVTDALLPFLAKVANA